MRKKVKFNLFYLFLKVKKVNIINKFRENIF